MYDNISEFYYSQLNWLASVESKRERVEREMYSHEYLKRPNSRKALNRKDQGISIRNFDTDYHGSSNTFDMEGNIILGTI